MNANAVVIGLCTLSLAATGWLVVSRPASDAERVAELERRLSELPRDREIVAYCRGPYCVMSLDAVHLLRRQGFKARRLEDGFPEWKSGGHPVEKGKSEESDDSRGHRTRKK